MQMRQRAFLLAACLVGTGMPCAALATRWQEAGIATDGVKVYVDTDSVSAGAGWVRVSQRFVFPRTHPGPLARVDQQVVYVCATRAVRTLRSVEFGKDGRVRRIDHDKSVAPYRITTGTLPEYVFDLLC
jgi:hypothetical protein